MKNWILGCDWGTSSFRLRLIDVVNAEIIGEVQSKNGIAQTYNLWMNSGLGSDERYVFFQSKLKIEIIRLAGQTNADLTGIPVIVTGMATSSIGMWELPYASLPFSMHAEGLTMKLFPASHDFDHTLMLVSGVRDSQDVMRGEEVQLIGLMQGLAIPEVKEMVVILPGTHSKHNSIKENALVSFQTFMTGEVFHLMATQSILKDSIEIIEEDTDNEAFEAGVLKGQSANLLASLFSVRTNTLFGNYNKSANAYYLSGLLIGSELGYLQNDSDTRPIVLCGGGRLHGLYFKALRILQLQHRTIDLPEESVTRATIAGQITIFKHYFHTFSNSI